MMTRFLFGARSLVLSICVVATAAAQSDPAEDLRDGRKLLLKSGQFDPLTAEPEFPAAWTARPLAADEVGAHVVQWSHQVGRVERRRLGALGIQLLEYIPNNAFLVRATPRQLTVLQRDADVRALIRFHAAYRVSPSLFAAQGQGRLALTVVLSEGVDTVDGSAAVVALGAEIVEWDGPGDSIFDVEAPADLVDDIARVESVQWVQATPVATLRNDSTSWVIQSNKSNNHAIWDEDVYGRDVIVGHIDDAIDIDSCYFDDPGQNIGPNHRKIVAHHGSSGSGDSHGTHTAGTAAGDQEFISGQTDGNGMGYKARLAHTNLSLISGSNLNTKLEELYNDGARVFTNSWGNDGTTSYDVWARDIDKFAWDNQDALPCWAVTNLSTLKNPENAKNCLAVGATEQANNQSQHCSGGRGPTADGRRKPEVYAPGCNIVSARSGSSCSTRSMSGTSMASPAIAGAGALVIEYYEKGFYPSGAANGADGFTPSGALVKASLINAAVDMTGVSGYPSDTEGWGRLNLDRSLMFSSEARKLIVKDVRTTKGFGASGETHSYVFDLTNSNRDLDITLAFTDKEGSANSSAPVVNDVDLEVVDPNGLVYKGNRFSGGESSTGGSFDPLNNVERVRHTSPATGRWTVNVIASNITTGKKQSYALVLNGSIVEPNDGFFTAYGSGHAGSGGFEPTLSGTGVPNIGNAVSLDVDDGLGGALSKLFIGFARDNLPILDGEILVAPPWLFVNFTLSGSGAGNGNRSLSGNIPNDANLIGLTTNNQVLIFDPGASSGVAFTPGLEMVIGG